ncbi:hypothetical protein NKT77_09870 [Moraxella sp. FZLJ2107]|uniref:hypothetical protein n=1 Tax=unclassified Moraxella TaxID=2685852 RepID=UPI0020C8DC43|nr:MULTISPECIES: hypothetical protein [unclassified Moraxella]UTO04794.1 hypothetical protein NKT77_09870 [Moraxella sp. FZLJ2107]UTO21526.1 hypothetical protein NKU06_06675 [Moraxella sp. FZLJ2109]
MNTKFSLDKKATRDNNKTLSKIVSDTANIAKTWLFLRPNHATNGIDASANPSYTGVKRLSSYDGVTPQNKPFFGEYVGRLLTIPRVNPITLFGRFSQTQKIVGAFNMNAISNTIISTINKFAIFTPVESLVLGFIFGLPIACVVIGILAVMGV